MLDSIIFIFKRWCYGEEWDNGFIKDQTRHGNLNAQMYINNISRAKATLFMQRNALIIFQQDRVSYAHLAVVNVNIIQYTVKSLEEHGRRVLHHYGPRNINDQHVREWNILPNHLK